MSKNFKQSNSTDLIKSFYPEHRLIHFSVEDKEKARPNEGDYSNERATRDAWINSISSNICVKFFESFFQEIGSKEKVKIWQEKSLPAIWEFSNGTALTLEDKRIVIIPKDNWNTKDFIVPAEWIKISEWKGDYYVAIQVNLDERWIRIWGYTTYEHIQAGRYDSRLRNYHLTSEELNSDIYTMLEGRLKDPVIDRDADGLTVMESCDFKTMMLDLAQPSSFSPRYKIDINRWCAFIADKQRRNELYQRRRLSITVNIKNWFKGIFEDFDYIPNRLTPQFLDIDSHKLKLQKEIFQKRVIYLEKKTFILEIIAKKNQQRNSDLFLKIYFPVKSDFLDLPVGLKAKIMDTDRNTLVEKIVTKGNARLECDIREIQENETYFVEISLDNFYQNCRFSF